MEELNPRHREILRLIVLEHISTGEPVGSSTLAGRDLAVSPATVRSVMADLEEMGLLEKPHTSAGRVPTDRGYRYFVDALVQIHPPSRPDRELIERSLPKIHDTDEILRETSRILSALSHYAAVVTIPHPAQMPLERIEFLQLRENRVMAILVSRSGLVRNLLLVDFLISSEELARAAAWLNELLTDAPLETVRERLLSELAREQSEYDELEKKALAIGQRVVDAAESNSIELHIQGRESFFEAPEFADLKRMRQLFLALEEKNKLVAVLDRTLNGREVKIFLGTESEFCARTGTSVVAAPYESESGIVGSVGIIGPTRMNYSHAIALVDYTARVVSRLLCSDW